MRCLPDDHRRTKDYHAYEDCVFHAREGQFVGQRERVPFAPREQRGCSIWSTCRATGPCTPTRLRRRRHWRCAIPDSSDLRTATRRRGVPGPMKPKMGQGRSSPLVPRARSLAGSRGGHHAWRARKRGSKFPSCSALVPRFRPVGRCASILGSAMTPLPRPILGLL
jgi:hypothetical protein